MIFSIRFLLVSATFIYAYLRINVTESLLRSATPQRSLYFV